MAGRIHPSDGPRVWRPRDDAAARAGWEAERKVYEALARNLPDDWTAWHGLRLLEGRRDAEADFVIADPRMGFLVVEVKSGRVTQSDGRWYYGSGRPMERPPLDQAYRAARLLCAAVDREMGRKIEVPFAVAAWFPDTDGDVRPTNADLRDAVLLAADLEDPIPALRRAFAARLVPGNAPPSPSWIDVVSDLWGRDFEPKIEPLRRIDRLEEARARLNEAQLAVLRGLSANPRVLVEGAAGTGKTTVARLYAEEVAWSGKRVLFLCFTDPLAHWLDASFAPLRSHGLEIRATTLRRLAHEIAGGGPPPADHAGWMALLDAAVERACREAVGADVLFVDEVQCFGARDLALLERIAGRERPMWAFLDPAQAFWERPPLPEGLARGAVRFALPKQRRAPESLAALARAYADRRADADLARAAEAEGTFGLVVRRATEASAERALADVLHDLDASGVDRRHVAVLSLVGRDASTIVGRPAVANVPAVPADAPSGHEAVVVDTFLRFEGLERPVVVLCEGDHPSAARNYMQRMYMAVTRAAARVVVVAGPALVDRDPILGPVVAERIAAPGSP